jgi:predicted deacylase
MKLVMILAAAVLGAAPARATPHMTLMLGRSWQGRPIQAFEVGDPGGTRVLVVGCIHGDETAGIAVARALMQTHPARLDLWIVPDLNPDGVAAGTRQNAHGVDLNRNYPYKWAPLGGGYDSGPKPASEPETRAMMRFLKRVRPAYILSFHQPLHGVDITERPKFSRRVARALHLPMEKLNCGSTCHGTMTMWFNHRFKGFALTVEYGAHPAAASLRAAPDKLLHLFGAWRGGVRGVSRSG